MALSKHKLGEFIELLDNRNVNLEYGPDDVRGVNNLKQLMPTKADISGRDLTKFQIVHPGDFVFNHRTSRNGSKFSIAYNDLSFPDICTEDYVVFRIKSAYQRTLHARWLYMFFNRPEFDRYVITNSWGSSTEFYNWEDICEVELALPSFEIQSKYVDIYNAMLDNQRVYESGLEDMKLVCDGYIEALQKSLPMERIGSYLKLSEQRNDLGLTVDAVRGIATSKEFISTKADMDGVSLDNYKVVPPRHIAYVADTSRRGDKISLAHNDTEDTFLVSSISVVFSTVREKLLDEYLMLFFTRSEFDRYSRFHSWGSAREAFDWADMCDVEIPIPELPVQRAIADIYKSYITRKRINEQLKAQIKELCPILIKGSLEEGA